MDPQVNLFFRPDSDASPHQRRLLFLSELDPDDLEEHVSERRSGGGPTRRNAMDIRNFFTIQRPSGKYHQRFKSKYNNRIDRNFEQFCTSKLVQNIKVMCMLCILLWFGTQLDSNSNQDHKKFIVIYEIH